MTEDIIEVDEANEKYSKGSEKETRVTIVVNAEDEPWSTTLFCGHCQSYVISEMGPIVSTTTHIIFFIMCLLGCCLCAPLIYGDGSYMPEEYYCPVCQHRLSVYNV